MRALTVRDPASLRAEEGGVHLLGVGDEILVPTASIPYPVGVTFQAGDLAVIGSNDTNTPSQAVSGWSSFSGVRGRVFWKWLAGGESGTVSGTNTGEGTVWQMTVWRGLTNGSTPQQQAGANVSDGATMAVPSVTPAAAPNLILVFVCGIGDAGNSAGVVISGSNPSLTFLTEAYGSGFNPKCGLHYAIGDTASATGARTIAGTGYVNFHNTIVLGFH